MTKADSLSLLFFLSPKNVIQFVCSLFLQTELGNKIWTVRWLLFPHWNNFPFFSNKHHVRDKATSNGALSFFTLSKTNSNPDVTPFSSFLVLNWAIKIPAYYFGISMRANLRLLFPFKSLSFRPHQTCLFFSPNVMIQGNWFLTSKIFLQRKWICTPKHRKMHRWLSF